MSMAFDLRGIDDGQVGRLMELLSRTDVVECDIEQGELRLSVRRDVRADPIASRGQASPGEEASAREEGIVIPAPAVGVFFRSEQLSGAPTVEVGSPVKSGDVLGCIEVMTVPHKVFSPRDGVVESFLVEDGQPVEYGQPIVAISSQQSAISHER